MQSDYLRFRQLFAEAMDSRLYTIEWLDDQILSMRAQIWFSDSASIVTEIKEYPTGARVIHGLVAAGDLHEIVEQLIPKAEEWGRQLGCALAIIESREGWARALKQYGYEPFQTAIAKGL